MRNQNRCLLAWVKKASDDDIANTGTTRAYLKQIAYGNKIPSAEIASRIEKTTSGQVTRPELRPADWWIVWPELISSSDLPPSDTPQVTPGQEETTTA
ncbi:transcriptional regulator [Chromohalobacter nigrandesensis]|uniref:transcriptional regulator n=1 Tax=Chromohalobacter nigrandesensis TaxID=119863 RepID=UPI001FF43E6A|nr:YdaS family helix-turn-helix protein [Chromohalobacter nigrandesensis]MCK0743587.1 helix-turn-helix domain-containing protein [Chromohalobacter nigrandesensis]